MKHLQSLPWIEPIECARQLGLGADNAPEWVLLYSSAQTSYSGRYSFLACQPMETISGHDFSTLKKKASSGCAWYENMWFGYLGYGLKNSLESLVIDTPSWIQLPALTMTRFGTVFRFDHEARRLDCWVESGVLPVLAPSTQSCLAVPKSMHITSNMSTQEYLGKVRDIIARIHDGELYQANLTRKFTGEFTHPPDALAVFSKLCEVSPAPYSAFLKYSGNYILSSSPELFLQIDAQGKVRTRPIKGTAERFIDMQMDRESSAKLACSAKDRAENLMIVDLMRNDLSRTCILGTVMAQPLFEVTTHATIHHMSSTITAQKRPDCSTVDVISHSFPPGSMTGAPKIKAMNLCSQLEKLERGIYSGAIGWLGGDGSCELSVVIRTLVISGNHWEFQVGGAIVADSIPENELHETVNKSKGLLLTLALAPIDLDF